MPQYILHINGSQKTVETEDDTPLLYVLRDNLELNGPKFGCGLSQCGACMVLIDGVATTSCMRPISSIGESKITTIEGLASENGKLHVVQEAFIEEQAAQCGYCLNGMVMASVSLLNDNPKPTDQEIRSALQLNLCRCSTHSRIIKAVQTASKKL
ncbi:(2Fe-2S)-binding protein [Algoriphagus machipongonensis]|uniref:Isoquinoline 1-oxidoreductase n=1 Tax=Algoriphagus machipongonensis TaxID=388413 RepID=A3I0C0_9BACT|nr:(2Fe-2S)-binding protein [Algoriphagus machipongonensis]EAZ79916.1 putative isoquinoline 1-oxidoreductase [Algoriphagus machipongonensis]